MIMRTVMFEGAAVTHSECHAHGSIFVLANLVEAISQVLVLL